MTFKKIKNKKSFSFFIFHFFTKIKYKLILLGIINKLIEFI
jgi:hypothetical protein